MSKKAKIEVRLRVDKDYLKNNIKVNDDEFNEMLEKATNSYVSLGDLVLNFWFYKEKITLEVRDYIFSKVYVRIKMQGAESHLPISSYMKITSSASPIKVLGEFNYYSLKSLPRKSADLFVDYEKYFGSERECVDMPLYKLKELADFFAILFPNRLAEIDGKEFPASLTIQYVK